MRTLSRILMFTMALSLAAVPSVADAASKDEIKTQKGKVKDAKKDLKKAQKYNKKWNKAQEKGKDLSDLEADIKAFCIEEIEWLRNHGIKANPDNQKGGEGKAGKLRDALVEMRDLIKAGKPAVKKKKAALKKIENQFQGRYNRWDTKLDEMKG